MSPAGPFDLARLRENWGRGDAPPPADMPARLAAVPPPRDIFGVARALLARVERLASMEYPRHAGELAPFFAEARRLLDAMTSQGNETPETAHELRLAFEEQIHDIEELLEVYDSSSP